MSFVFQSMWQVTATVYLNIYIRPDVSVFRVQNCLVRSSSINTMALLLPKNVGLFCILLFYSVQLKKKLCSVFAIQCTLFMIFCIQANYFYFDRRMIEVLCFSDCFIQRLSNVSQIFYMFVYLFCENNVRCKNSCEILLKFDISYFILYSRILCTAFNTFIALFPISLNHFSHAISVFPLIAFKNNSIKQIK